MKLTYIVRRVNIARPVCNHMLGSEHTHGHRMLVGTVVMGIGVSIAKVAGHHELAAIAFLGDAIGYAVHGLGLTPFAEYLLVKFGEHAE